MYVCRLIQCEGFGLEISTFSYIRSTIEQFFENSKLVTATIDVFQETIFLKE